MDFSRITDAVTRVTQAQWVASDQGSTAHCKVGGYVEPRIEFVLHLPSERWNGKFVELGCGGPCGTLAHAAACADPLERGYACIVSDGGHKVEQAEPMKWADGNPQAAIEYMARASHATALAGKGIVQRYYGKDARKSYFLGCSAGGVQAMWLAQKFPWDFDGIVAGGPAMSLSRIWLNWLWANRATTGADGKPLLGEADLELLHQRAVAKCDLDDGVKDGVIGDPRTCTFDPAELRCARAKDGQCLTEEQIKAVAKVYGGPVTSKGEQIVMPLAVRGSERTWPVFEGSASHPNSSYTYFKAWHHYAIFDVGLPGSWQPRDFDFDRDYKRLGSMEALEPLFHTDLRRLKAAGTKLLVYTGWNDSIEGVHNTADYYETVERVMGGRAITQESFRLFIVPGMNHCAGGEGVSVFDWLGSIEAWVERGQAPDKLIGSRVGADNKVEFSRPVYPYPVRAHYSGRGDPNDASSFKPVDP